MAKKSTEQYILEALEAAQFAADSVMPTRSYGGVGPSARRYPSSASHPVESHAGHSHGLGGGDDITPIIQALIKESGGRVKVVSGKRSAQRQAELFAQAVRKYGSEAKARKWVAPPGRSRHQTGAAYDLGGDLNLAAQLASKFGLYRPMAHEPWHFERRGSRG